MKSQKVSCNSCGASLTVSPKSKFLTCSYCSSRLEIKKEGGAIFSLVLEEVKEIKDDVQIIKLQNKLERLDREWQMEKDRHLVSDKYGRKREPMTGIGLYIFLAIFVGVSLFMSSQASKMGAPGIFTIIPLAIGGFAVFSVIAGSANSKKYTSQKEKYKSKRQRLVQEIKRKS